MQDKTKLRNFWLCAIEALGLGKNLKVFELQEFKRYAYCVVQASKDQDIDKVEVTVLMTKLVLSLVDSDILLTVEEHKLIDQFNSAVQDMLGSEAEDVKKNRMRLAFKVGRYEENVNCRDK